MLNLCTFFHNLSKAITFAATPLVLTPFLRNRGSQGHGRRRAARRVPRLAHGRLGKFQQVLVQILKEFVVTVAVVT